MANKLRHRSLRRRADFLALRNQGHVFHVNSWLLLNWRLGEESHVRYGWTIPSHIGSAVLRNRLKRWGREFFRKSLRPSAGIDMNVILKRRPKGFYSALTHEEFDEAMAKATAKWR